MRVLVVTSTAETGERVMASTALAFPTAERQLLLDPLLAVKYNQDWDADMVVCELSMRIIDGVQLIKLLRRQNRNIVPVLLEPGEVHGRDADDLDIPHLPEPEASAMRDVWKRKTLKLESRVC